MGSCFSVREALNESLRASLSASYKFFTGKGGVRQLCLSISKNSGFASPPRPLSSINLKVSNNNLPILLALLPLFSMDYIDAGQGCGQDSELCINHIILLCAPCCALDTSNITALYRQLISGQLLIQRFLSNL